MLFDAAVADAMGKTQGAAFGQVLIKVHPVAALILGFAAITAGGDDS
jgi:hypothetical protein